MIHRWMRCLLAAALVAALPMHAASAQRLLEAGQCEYVESELVELEVGDLLELAFEPECQALLPAALDLAESRLSEATKALSSGQPGEDDELPQDALSDLLERQRFLSLVRIRRALDAGDTAQAERRLDALLSAPEPTRTEDEEQDDEDESLIGLKAELAAIQAMLSGRTPTPGFALQITAPVAEWQLSFSGCGTPAAMFDYLSRLLPTRAAAWHALGQPRAAFDVLLDAYWIDALELGQLPPQIREYADAAFGPGAFDQELQLGLKQIWIEPAVAGRYAYLPLFGRRLPLPLGYTSFSLRRPDPSQPEPQTTVFENADELAAFLRDRVLRNH